MPKLGEIIRAYRLGYGWNGDAFVRVSGERAPWRIDVRPDGLVPSGDKLGAACRLWWNADDGGGKILSMIRGLPHSPRHALTLYVDDNGVTVTDTDRAITGGAKC